MNKILHLSLTLLLALVCSNLNAQEVKFDFQKDWKTLFPTLKGLSANGSNDGDFTENTTATLDGVELTVTPSKGSTANRMWTKGPELRLYGGSLIIKAPAGKLVKSMSFLGAKVAPKADVGTASNTGWTGDPVESVTLGVVSNITFKSITVTLAANDPTAVAVPTISGEQYFEGSAIVTLTATDADEIRYTTDGTDPTLTTGEVYKNAFVLDHTATVKAIAVKGGKASDVASREFTKIEPVTIADLFAQLTATQVPYLLKFTNAKVVYVREDGTFFVREGDKAIQAYQTNITVKLNDVLNGTVYVDGLLYNNLPEIKGNGKTSTDKLQVTPATSNVLDPVEATIADILDKKYMNDLVLLKNVTITSSRGKYYANADGKKIQIFGNTSVVKNLANNDKTYNLIAVFNTIYNDASEILPVEATELTLDVKLSIGATGYATLYYGTQALVAPEGVQMFVYSVGADGQLQEKAVYKAGDNIPAGQPLVVKGTPNTEYTFEAVPDGASVEAKVESMLKGTDEEATTEGTGIFYKLAADNADATKAGFFWGAADGAAFTIPAHKVYLVVPKTANPAKAYFFDGTTTGIKAVDTLKAANDVVYTLSGVRMNGTQKLPKGIYVINGKKVVVK